MNARVYEHGDKVQIQSGALWDEQSAVSFKTYIAFPERDSLWTEELTKQYNWLEAKHMKAFAWQIKVDKGGWLIGAFFYLENVNDAIMFKMVRG